MGNTEFTEKAKELVREYTAEHLDKTDEAPALAYEKLQKARRETGGRRRITIFSALISAAGTRRRK